MATVYHINKGINKPIEFKGLKAQYIAYLGFGLVILLLLFTAMYLSGINLFICLLIIVILGLALFALTFRLSHQFGEYGLLKFLARKKVPEFLKSNSRGLFINLQRKEEHNGKTD